MQRSILGYARPKDDRTLEARREEAQAKRDAELTRLDLPWPRLQTKKKPGCPTRVDKYLDAVYGPLACWAGVIPLDSSPVLNIWGFHLVWCFCCKSEGHYSINPF
eukprot:453474-Amphidinium_carterae.1